MARTRATPLEEPTVDVAALAALLDGEHAAIRAQVRALLSQRRFAPRSGIGKRAYREKVLAWCMELAAEGIGLIGCPKRYGGRGDIAGGIAAFETIAFGDLSLLVKFGVQFGLFGGAIYHLGTARHHTAYLRAAATMELPGCFAMTETGHGSNVRDLGTTATYDPAARAFVINTPDKSARKDYIGNAAAHGRAAVVFAQLEVGGERHGVHAFVVPIRDERGRPCPGVRIEDCGEKLGLNGVDNGRIAFDDVAVPREAMLNRFANVSATGKYSSAIEDPSRRFFTMLGTLVQGRVSVATGGLSAAKSALTIAVRYGLKRRQFGPPGAPEAVLLDYRTHQRRLMPALATCYALDFALKDLVASYVRSLKAEPGSRERMQVESLAAGLKAFSTWHATETIQACREACGGAGYLAQNRFASLKADSDVFTTFEGDNTVLMQLVAKSLLTDYREQFEDMNIVGLTRLLLAQVLGAVAEATPSHNTSESHLLSREFQLGALRWREQHLLETLGRRLKRALDRGADGFTAFVECQDHAVATARAHVERVILERFCDAIDDAEPSLHATLERLRSLYALSRIERDRGWFQEHGHIAGDKSKAILALVNDLCAAVRADAAALVDAFGIPSAMLGAPIAR